MAYVSCMSIKCKYNIDYHCERVNTYIDAEGVCTDNEEEEEEPIEEVSE